MKQYAPLLFLLSDRFLAAESLQQCSDNPTCAALKLEGSCCPTNDFRWLDCCENDENNDIGIRNETLKNDNERIPATNRALTPSQCSAYSDCAHLAGDCCPTTSGVMLVSVMRRPDFVEVPDCCNSRPVVEFNTPEPSSPGRPAPAKAPYTPPTEPMPTAGTAGGSPKQCALYTGCANLAGDCCPTLTGVMLVSSVDCCNTPLVNGFPKPSAPTPATNSPVDDNIFSPPTPSPVPIEDRDDGIYPPITDLNVDWGSNVYLIDSSWSTSRIQNLVDSIHQKQVNNEMGNERYGIYFYPGVYGSPNQPLMIQLGYYTEIAGLGTRPSDVLIYGKIEVYNRCFDPLLFNEEGQFIPSDGSGHCIALNNFWRSLSNLSVHIISRNQDSCRSRANFWAVSQASSMRRVSFVNGDVSLMDYCTMPAFASGGFLADSKFAGQIENGSQQQWMSRNIDVQQNWSGTVWNQVFLGSVGVPSGNSFPDPPVSTMAQTPLSREKPYLFVARNGEFYVFVPSIVANTRGPSWDSRDTPGRSISLEKFLVITPSTPSQSIDQALRFGLNLLFTPGVYDIYSTIEITKANTVVLGIGHATLTARNGVVPIRTSKAAGIVLAGITVDAGESLSPYLLQIGSKEDPSMELKSNPITLSDVYVRVGGPYIGKTTVAIEINADDVLIDHTWIWRADHGIEPFDMSDGYAGDNERWRTNTGTNGLIVNGNSVTAMGLFVEHFQEYNLIWNGQDGKVYMFQSELVYETPSQSDWITPDGTLGYAAYKISNQVQRHYLIGGGVYCYNRNNPSIVTENGFDVPIRSGIVLERIMTRNLSGPGVIQSVINGLGAAADTNNRGPHYVVDYTSRSSNAMTAAESSSSSSSVVHQQQYEEIPESGDASHGMTIRPSLLSMGLYLSVGYLAMLGLL
eukprot:scaffold4266_cov83-Cylindrotheca_fusiformis.AAC.5